VPGNDPYVITVGALSMKRTPGYWGDDELPYFSATGPTLDSFAKPDILVPGTQIISFMYNECKASWATASCRDNSQALVRDHGDYSSTTNLFRMSGTSMSTAIASGVAALMIQVDPSLTPDQVKFRMKYSAQTAFADDSGEPVYNLLQQGYGRLWAPSAVWGSFPEGAADNVGMDIFADLAHGAGWVDLNHDGLVQYDELDPVELSYHYQGPIARMRSDDGIVDLYYTEYNGTATVLGAASAADHTWLDRSQLDALAPSWNNGQLTWVDSQAWTAGNWTWGGGNWTWGGGNWTWGGGNWTWGGGNWTWGGGNWTWGGGNWTWGGGNWTWGGGNWTWGGGNWTWGGGNWTWGGGNWTWEGSAWMLDSQSSSSSTIWVDD
jgi:serine protease AprX